MTKKQKQFLYFKKLINNQRLLFFNKKYVFTQIKNIPTIESVYYYVKIKLTKFQKDCSKTVGEDRFLIK